MKTVFIGLSGGVDSAVAAFLLKKQGYNVIGAFMKNFSDTKNKFTGECSWRDEWRMAQKVAAHLKIKFVTFDFEKQYKEQVIKPMIRDYSKGLTPNPDSLCNTIVKFPLFWKEAKKRGADFIAMGHYIKRKQTTNGFALLRSKDKEKDQSYFLYTLTQEDLSHTLFPIGDYTKSEVREIAKRNKFPNHDKQGTRGICFVGKVNLQEFLKPHIKSKKGLIKDPKMNVIGNHPGISYFTIGQRIGPHLGFDIDPKVRNKSGKKWYIAEKIKSSNTLIVAPEGHPILKRKEIKIKNLHLINPRIKIPKNITVKIRHRGKLLKAKFNNSKIMLLKPEVAIAEGQSVVLYDKNLVLGGGEISY